MEKGSSIYEYNSRKKEATEKYVWNGVREHLSMLRRDEEAKGRPACTVETLQCHDLSFTVCQSSVKGEILLERSLIYK